MKSYIFSGALACAMLAGSVFAEKADKKVSNGSDPVMDSFKEMAMQFAEDKEQERELFVYHCKNIQGETLRDVLENFISPVGMLSDSEESDAVVILDEASNIPILKKIAEDLDKEVEQVLVGARIVEIYMNDGYEKEIALSYQQFNNIDKIGKSGASTDFADKLTSALVPSAPALGSAGFISYDAADQELLSGFLSFLESNGKAQVLSSPNLILRRGVSGNILSGEDIPINELTITSSGNNYSTEYKSIGIKLQVEPKMIIDDSVRLSVSPEVSNITRYETTGAGEKVPVIAIRNASTELTIKDGQMVSIGGLLREEARETKSRVPILGSIPLLGTLFRSTNTDNIQSQLVIFLTAKVLDENDMHSTIIDSPNLGSDIAEEVKIIEESMNKFETDIIRDIKKAVE